MYEHKIHASSHYVHEKEIHYVMIKQWEHRWVIGTLEEKEKRTNRPEWEKKTKKKCYKFLPWILRISDGSRKFSRRFRREQNNP